VLNVTERRIKVASIDLSAWQRKKLRYGGLETEGNVLTDHANHVAGNGLRDGNEKGMPHRYFMELTTTISE
jgi:hypothetical protein